MRNNDIALVVHALLEDEEDYDVELHDIVGEPYDSVFMRAYIEAIYWTDEDHWIHDVLKQQQEGDMLSLGDVEGYDLALSSEFKGRIVDDCQQFESDNAGDIGERVVRAGHDFWLTRQGEFQAFNDGDWPEPQASRLTKAAKAYGRICTWVGEDGLVYADSL